MPSFQDSAVIFFIALLLFGPKKLPELARQLGKLMGEFRRASNEFRMQMEDELRASEQADRQKQIAALEAAAPVAPALAPENVIANPDHAIAAAPAVPDTIEGSINHHSHTTAPEPHAGDLNQPLAELPAALPIAVSGDLHLMPPATGLPIRHSPGSTEISTLAPVFDAIPSAPDRHTNTAPDRVAQTNSGSDEAVTHA